MQKGEKSENKCHYTDYPTRLIYLPRGTERLEKLGVVRRFPKNYILAEPGEIPSMCYIVKVGRVISFEFTPGGEERVYNFHEEGAMLLEDNVLTDQCSPIYFKTSVASELVCIERDNLIDAMRMDAQIMMDVVQSISNKFFGSMDQIRENCSHNAMWKIGNLLLIFADKHGVLYDGKIMIKEKVSQQMLSNLLGINRITTVRIMKDLKDLGMIEQINGYYCIRDVEVLREYLNEFGNAR